MKNNLFHLGITSFLFLLLLVDCTEAQSGSRQEDPAFKVRITMEDVKDTTLYLAYHYGNKQYIEDTFRIDANGVCEFSKDSIWGGIYLVVFPSLGNNYFEIVLTDEDVDLKTKSGNFVKHMQVNESTENKLFYDDLQFINLRNGKISALQQQLDSLEKGDPKKKEIRKQLTELNEEIKANRTKLIEENQHLLYGKILKAIKDVEIPEAPKNPDGSLVDSFFQYKYYRAHFWDNFDLQDKRLLRTPIFHNKLKQFHKSVLVQAPDSLNRGADEVLEKARGNDETFKYALVFFLNKAANSKIMGMDACYVHLVEKYYATGEAWWTDSTQLYRIVDRAKTLKPLLIGKPAPDLLLRDRQFKPKSLHSVQSDYTILVFWDPDCGHCKKDIPKLGKLTQELKDIGATIYAVGTDEYEKWGPFIDEKGLNGWIHVYPYAKEEHAFRDFYDISSTPKVFVLDKDKKIIAKRIGVDQLVDFLKRHRRIEERKAAQNKG